MIENENDGDEEDDMGETGAQCNDFDDEDGDEEEDMGKTGAQSNDAKWKWLVKHHNLHLKLLVFAGAWLHRSHLKRPDEATAVQLDRGL